MGLGGSWHNTSSSHEIENFRPKSDRLCECVNTEFGKRVKNLHIMSSQLAHNQVWDLWIWFLLVVHPRPPRLLSTTSKYKSNNSSKRDQLLTPHVMCFRDRQCYVFKHVLVLYFLFYFLGFPVTQIQQIYMNSHNIWQLLE